MLILRYSALVKRALHRVVPRVRCRVEQADLASCGMLGLIDAIEKFRVDRRIKFETYAAIRIEGAMLDHLRSLDWLPRSMRAKKRELEEACRVLEHALGRTPTESEVAAHLGVQLSSLHKLLRDLHAGTFVSLEASSDGEEHDEATLREQLPDPAAGPEQAVIEAEHRRSLARALSRLPRRERTVVALYYFGELRLRQIGRIIGLSEAAVSMIHSAALARLRAHMQA